ncbi:MAG: short-chain dehydrogenase/reductase [Actinobacteria bacterium HGW-Actinobacteria-6]|jgi:NAD(P)-dependent dehydrogenase (short-subunit alcohol dehydrogenase family)|nr:MAG: short-chain dehydrogenase/reductase [Actinobacteria bacterium HGW-Actinobacteria-6]
MSSQKVVLITGASSGNGQAIAQLLSQEGYKVFGTSRNPSSAQPIPNVVMLALDVRDDDSVAACVGAVTDQAGHLDVLVNNAGYELAGALEELSLDEAKAQFETNFFGIVRMVKAVLPLMRQQEGGQIINISSLAGLSPVPFVGIYSASKFAVEGYTEALRLEVQPLGIQVSQIEAGFLKTPMMTNRQVATERIGEYEPWRQRALEAIRSYEEKGPGSALVAETVLKVVANDRPRLRYVIGRQAKRISRLRRFLPEGMFEKGARSSFHLDAEG